MADCGGGLSKSISSVPAGGGSLALSLYHCLFVKYIPQQALALGVSNMILCMRKISMATIADMINARTVQVIQITSILMAHWR